MKFCMLLLLVVGYAQTLNFSDGSIYEQDFNVNFVEGILDLQFSIEFVNPSTLLNIGPKIAETKKKLSKQHLNNSSFIQQLEHATSFLHSTINRHCKKWINIKKINRTKRGLLDIGGDVLQALFGVSTEKDLTIVVKNLQTQHKQIKLIHSAVEILRNATNMIQTSLIKIEESVNILSFLFTTEQILFEITNVGSACIQMTNIYLEGRSGLFPIEHINKNKLLKTLEETRKLWALIPFRTLNFSNVEQFFKDLPFKIEKLENTLTYNIQIPFINPLIFKHYILKSFPMPIKSFNTTLTSNDLYKVALKDNQIYLSTESFALHTQDHVKCLKVDMGEKICMSNIRRHLNKIPCELQLITHKQPTKCKFVQEKKNSGFIQMRKYNIIFTSPNESLLTDCRNEITKSSHRYIGQNTLILPKWCSFNSDTLKYTSVSHRLINDFEVAYTVQNLTFLSNIPKINNHSLIKPIPPFHIHDTNENNMWAYIMHPVHGVRIIIEMVLVICVGVLVIHCCCKKKIEPIVISKTEV